jgi:glycosyltransferase involved in cell wall biosynthesis
MHIWFVQRWEPTPIDKDQNQRLFRTGSMINAALKENHSVVWWTSTFDHFTKKNRYHQTRKIKVKQNYEISFIHTAGYKKNTSPLRYLDNILFAYSLYKEFKRSKQRPDLIISSFPVPEIVFASIYFAKAENIKTITDIRDLWPDTILDKFIYLRPLVSLLLIPMRKINNYIFSNSDAIIGNSDEFVEWGLKIANTKRIKTKLDTTFNMGYVEKKYTLSDYKKAKKFWRNYNILKENNYIIVTFLGTIGFNFDFNLIIEAAKICLERNLKVHFFICGDGPRLNELKNKSKELKNIFFSGWLDGVEIKYLNRMSDIGLAPYLNTKNFVDNLPNKIAEYMFGRNAIALSLNEGKMYKIIKEYSCGFTYKSSNDLVSKISELIDQPLKLKKLKTNSYAVYKTKLNGTKIYNNFIKYLNSFRYI